MNFKNYKTSTLVSFIVILAIFCNAIYLKLDEFLIQFARIKEISNYLGFLSILGLMTLVIKLIDSYFWKSEITNLIIEIPDLNGRYEGVMTSSYIDPITKKAMEMKCVMEIIQNASNVHVFTYIGKKDVLTSSSETICEVLKKKENGFYTLYYNYRNNSNLNVEFNDHKGTAYLDFFPDIESLQGNYFNERRNNGSIDVKLVSKNLIGRFNEK